MVVQFDHVEDLCVANKWFGEAAGAHGVVVFADSRFVGVDFSFECVVDQGDQAQLAAGRIVREQPVDVGKHGSDVELDRALGVAVARAAPFDAVSPARLRSDKALEVGFEFEG